MLYTAPTSGKNQVMWLTYKEYGPGIRYVGVRPLRGHINHHLIFFQVLLPILRSASEMTNSLHCAWWGFVRLYVIHTHSL